MRELKDKGLLAVIAITPIIIAIMLITAIDGCTQTLRHQSAVSNRHPIGYHRVAYTAVADDCAPPEEVAFGDSCGLPLDTSLIDDGVERHLNNDGRDAPDEEDA